MVTISCSGKFHAFALAEQMERKKKLGVLYTAYSYQKNRLARNFVNRVDNEKIPATKIKTHIPLAVMMKLQPAWSFRWNDLFDKWVSGNLKKSSSKIFIGWSGMSLECLRVAKEKGMRTIVERGSTHILYQDAILKEEYKKFGIKFSIDQTVVDKELKEYDSADYISIPSFFVRDSFIEQGVNEEKLHVNPYGASHFFSYRKTVARHQAGLLRLVYLGTLSIRKGLIYLFEALALVSIPDAELEVWFIGAIAPELQPLVDRLKKKNWRFIGHVSHYELGGWLSQCDIGIQPSLEEGLSMVIPQMMSCGLPVIVTHNTGGGNIVTDGVDGFLVPIRDPRAIAGRIEELYEDRGRLLEMQVAAAAAIESDYTWDNYGDRYLSFIDSILADRASVKKS